MVLKLQVPAANAHLLDEIQSGLQTLQTLHILETGRCNV